MMNNTYINREAKAWIKRRKGADEIVHVIPHVVNAKGGQCYKLYTAFDDKPEYLGRILFDANGYWIYDGDELTIAEQEQLARFIMNYAGHL